MAKRAIKMKIADSGMSSRIAATNAIIPWLPSWLNRDWFWGLILVLAVIATYTPVWWAGYVWDDDGYIAGNPCVDGLRGLKEIWTTSAADISPLAITTFGLEYALWGLAPLGYHLANVFQHAACAIVLWQVLRSLQIPGAWLGAALWALHPVEVESVAWVSEMKNTESGFFFLLSILFFVRWLKAKEKKDNWNYALVLLFAALAMASKSSTVVLPVVLGLCAWWVEGRWYWRNLARVAPIFLVSIVASALSIWTQGLTLATDTDPQWVRTWPQRLITAGDAVWFYLGKLLWPHPLMAIYPRWQVDAGQWILYLPVLAVIIVLFILWFYRESWSRPWFFAFAYFLAALLPVLGLVGNPIFRYSLVFDHFQYLASMAPLVLAEVGLIRLGDSVISRKPWLQSTLCAGLLLVLGVTSWQRAWVYESGETLWTDTLGKNPNCWMAHNNLGVALFQKGEINEGLSQFQEALKINPNDAEAHYNFGCFFLQNRQLDEAIARFQEALKNNPSYADAYNNLGTTFLQKGQLDEAITQLQKALAINHNFANARINLGNAFIKKGQLGEAVVEYQKALEINPDDALTHNNLGIALVKKGQTDEAIVQFQKAIQLRPDYTQAQDNLTRTETMAGASHQ